MPKTTATIDTGLLQTAPSIAYRLSEKWFLDAGWTTRPCVPQQEQQEVIMNARFAHSDICPWFKEREEDFLDRYPNGQILYIARKNGSGKIYYPNGRVAVDIEKAETLTQIPRTKIWIYHSGEVERDGKRKPVGLCAVFESLGNGIVYGDCLRKRLVYNQKEGILYTPFGIPIRWKWHDIQVNKVQSATNSDEGSSSSEVDSIDKSIAAKKESTRATTANSSLSSEENQSHRVPSKREIEFQTRIDEMRYLDTGRIYPRKVAPIKPIVLQLNKHIALRILNQSDVSLSFCADGKLTQLKLGILYNPYDRFKVSKVEIEPGPNEILCSFENFPANTHSLVKFRNLMDKLKRRCALQASG
ncbi:hypothetical protein RUM43_014054 [Polyplax serrata]|uniref:FAM194 C-terminal domain-containing protein n=1 Tax=Polyplax serrata TaxID=468196 RepID=A0AAN8PBJ2_POLSC